MVNYRLITQLHLGSSSYRAIQVHCDAAHVTLAKTRRARPPAIISLYGPTMRLPPTMVR